MRTVAPIQKILLVRQKSPKKQKTNFAAILYHLWAKVSNMRPFLSNPFPQGFLRSKKFGHWTSRSGVKKTIKRREQKKILKNIFVAAILHPLWEKFWNLTPLLFITFSQGIQKSKKFAHWSLGKRPLKGMRNINTKKIRLSKAKLAQKLTFFARQFYTLY